MKYKLKQIKDDWIEIEGLLSSDNYYRTPLPIGFHMGMDYSLDCIESIFAAIYGGLYDLYQCYDEMKEGDVFAVEPFKYFTYRPNQGNLDIEIPAWEFVAQDVHVLPIEETVPDFEAYDKWWKERENRVEDEWMED